MVYNAHVWITRRPGEGRIDLGKIEVDPKPERDVVVSFEHQGKSERGLVDQIDPYDWEKRSGIVPRIHVRLEETSDRLAEPIKDEAEVKASVARLMKHE